MRLPEITALVAGHRDVAQWQVRERRTVRSERYLTFLDLDCERQTERTTWEVWLSLPAADGQHGEAEFEIDIIDAPALVRLRLESAVANARAATQPAWKLPGPQTPGAARTAVDVLASEITPWLMVDRVTAVFSEALAASPWAEAASLECFSRYNTVHLVNSRGLDLTDQRQELEVEYVLLHDAGDSGDVELYDHCQAVGLGELDLGRRVQVAAEALRAGVGAAPPPSGPAPVLLPDHYLHDLFGYLVYHADAAVHVRSLNRLAVGDAVAADAGELFLESDPQVPSTGAYGFDAFGYAPVRQEVVRGGVIESLHGEARWMQQLGLPPRGMFGTMVVRPGLTDLNNLREPGVLEVVQLSDFGPRMDTGAFAGEIRLAWLHQADGSRRPVRGGSLTGSVTDALAGLRLCREVGTIGAWRGPRAGLLPRVTVTV